MDTYKGYSFLSLEDQISIINENQLESTANSSQHIRKSGELELARLTFPDGLIIL